MSDIALTTDGDLDLAGAALYLVTGADAIRQALQIKLRHFSGEWFLDTTFGVPWFSLLEKGVDPRLVEDTVKRAIMEVDGVETLLQFGMQFDGATRTASIDFTVRVDGGDEVNVEGFEV